MAKRDFQMLDADSKPIIEAESEWVCMNKRAIENFIKAGAFDSFGAARRQLMMVYVQILDNVVKERKNSMAGQMSLFDLAAEEDKADFEISLPDVEEYSKETLLAFEKEVLGVYISGHPLEEYEKQWRSNITAVTSDFALDESSGRTKVRDGQQVVVGGLIVDKTIKYTKNNKVMEAASSLSLISLFRILTRLTRRKPA